MSNTVLQGDSDIRPFFSIPGYSIWSWCWEDISYFGPRNITSNSLSPDRHHWPEFLLQSCDGVTLGSPAALQNWVATASISQASFRGQRSRVTKPGEWRSVEAELFSVSSSQPFSIKHTSFWQSGPVDTHTHITWPVRPPPDLWPLSLTQDGWRVGLPVKLAVHTHRWKSTHVPSFWHSVISSSQKFARRRVNIIGTDEEE